MLSGQLLHLDTSVAEIAPPEDVSVWSVGTVPDLGIGVLAARATRWRIVLRRALEGRPLDPIWIWRDPIEPLDRVLGAVLLDRRERAALVELCPVSLLEASREVLGSRAVDAPRAQLLEVLGT